MRILGCKEFEKITGVIEWYEDKAISMLTSSDTTMEVTLEFLQNKKSIHHEDFLSWYITLRAATSLTGTAAKDISGMNDYKLQVEYLRRSAFIRYYRPYITSLMIFLERVRVLNNKSEWSDLISELVNKLSDLGIIVNYVATGTNYSAELFEDILITESEDQNVPEGKVLEVKAYGVNPTDIEVPVQKTEVIMNL